MWLGSAEPELYSTRLYQRSAVECSTRVLYLISRIWRARAHTQLHQGITTYHVYSTVYSVARRQLGGSGPDVGLRKEKKKGTH